MVYDNSNLENLDSIGGKLLKVVLFFIILVLVIIIILIFILLEKLIDLENKFVGILKSEGYKNRDILCIFMCFTSLLLIISIIVSLFLNIIWLFLSKKIIYNLWNITLVFDLNYLIILYLVILFGGGLLVNLVLYGKINKIEIIFLFC